MLLGKRDSRVHMTLENFDDYPSCVLNEKWLWSPAQKNDLSSKFELVQSAESKIERTRRGPERGSTLQELQRLEEVLISQELF